MSKKLENDRQDQDCKSDCSSCGNISAEDIEIPSWALQRFQEDASRLVERLEKNHELKYLEPPEELFQKILGETREKGLLREETQKQKKETKKKRTPVRVRRIQGKESILDGLQLLLLPVLEFSVSV